MTPASLRRLVAKGEGPTLEFKRSTGALREGIEALCGMLNGTGRGQVLFGVSDSGKIVGQMVTESTRGGHCSRGRPLHVRGTRLHAGG